MFSLWNYSFIFKVLLENRNDFIMKNILFEYLYFLIYFLVNILLYIVFPIVIILFCRWIFVFASDDVLIYYYNT